MDNWEYIKRDQRLDEKDLNELGAQGWELVGVVSNTWGDIDTTPEGRTPYFIGKVTGKIRTSESLIFKRRKQ